MTRDEKQFSKADLKANGWGAILRGARSGVTGVPDEALTGSDLLEINALTLLGIAAREAAMSVVRAAAESSGDPKVAAKAVEAINDLEKEFAEPRDITSANILELSQVLIVQFLENTKAEGVVLKVFDEKDELIWIQGFGITKASGGGMDEAGMDAMEGTVRKAAAEAGALKAMQEMAAGWKKDRDKEGE